MESRKNNPLEIFELLNLILERLLLSGEGSWYSIYMVDQFWQEVTINLLKNKLIASAAKEDIENNIKLVRGSLKYISESLEAFKSGDLKVIEGFEDIYAQMKTGMIQNGFQQALEREDFDYAFWLINAHPGNMPSDLSICQSLLRHSAHGKNLTVWEAASEIFPDDVVRGVIAGLYVYAPDDCKSSLHPDFISWSTEVMNKCSDTEILFLAKRNAYKLLYRFIELGAQELCIRIINRLVEEHQSLPVDIVESSVDAFNLAAKYGRQKVCQRIYETLIKFDHHVKASNMVRNCNVLYGYKANSPERLETYQWISQLRSTLTDLSNNPNNFFNQIPQAQNTELDQIEVMPQSLIEEETALAIAISESKLDTVDLLPEKTMLENIERTMQELSGKAVKENLVDECADLDDYLSFDDEDIYLGVECDFASDSDESEELSSGSSPRF